MFWLKSYYLCITNIEIVQNSKSNPKKFSFLCTFNGLNAEKLFLANIKGSYLIFEKLFVLVWKFFLFPIVLRLTRTIVPPPMAHWNFFYKTLIFKQTHNGIVQFKIGAKKFSFWCSFELTIPGLPYKFLPVSCGGIGLEKILGLVLARKSGLRVPLLLLGPSCPVQNYSSEWSGPVWNPLRI